MIRRLKVTIATWMLRALWLVVAYDLLWMTPRETCFLCFVQHGARFWKCVRLFRIKASESLEKNLGRAIYKEEKCRNGEKKALYNLRMPKNIMATSLFLPLLCFFFFSSLLPQCYEIGVYLQMSDKWIDIEEGLTWEVFKKMWGVLSVAIFPLMMIFALLDQT